MPVYELGQNSFTTFTDLVRMEINNGKGVPLQEDVEIKEKKQKNVVSFVVNGMLLLIN